MSKDKKFPVVVYNDAGQETYREDKNGHWVKRDYDDKGRQTYWETSRGGWAKHRYDDNGNETYYENSEGFWFKCEYNDKGFRTYYEDSDGKIIRRKGVEDLIADATNKSGATSAPPSLTEHQEKPSCKEDINL